jgi:hypothetical protein
MIRLNRARCNQRVGPLLQRLSNQEFQLAHFVSTEREARLIITFDE